MTRSKDVRILIIKEEFKTLKESRNGSWGGEEFPKFMTTFANKSIILNVLFFYDS